MQIETGTDIFSVENPRKVASNTSDKTTLDPSINIPLILLLYDLDRESEQSTAKLLAFFLQGALQHHKPITFHTQQPQR